MKKKDFWISLAIIGASGLVLLCYSQRKGFVGIDAGGADAVLHLRSVWPASIIITSGDEPAAIGARIYRPQFLRLSMRQDGQIWQVQCRGPWSELSKIKVQHNEATALRLGPPFRIRPVIEKNGSIISINYVIIGQAGEQYQKFVTKDDQAVREAKLKIVDETGQVLTSGRFKYG